MLLGRVPREQKMLKGHLPRVIYHQVYKYMNIKPFKVFPRGSEAYPGEGGGGRTQGRGEGGGYPGERGGYPGAYPGERGGGGGGRRPESGSVPTGFWRLALRSVVALLPGPPSRVLPSSSTVSILIVPFAS